jgi:hypothetical protein
MGDSTEYLLEQAKRFRQLAKARQQFPALNANF